MSNKNLLNFQQFILFCRTMGIGKTIKMVHKYPQFIITPALTFWTYNAVDISKAYCSMCSGFRKKSKKISIRYILRLDINFWSLSFEAKSSTKNSKFS